MATVLEKGRVENSGLAIIWMGCGWNMWRAPGQGATGLLGISNQATDLAVRIHIQHRTTPLFYKTVPILFLSSQKYNSPHFVSYLTDFHLFSANIVLLMEATFGPDPKLVIDCRISQVGKDLGGLSFNHLFKARSTQNGEPLSKLMERSSLSSRYLGPTPLFSSHINLEFVLTATPLSNLSSFD